jgi:ribosomal protein S12 methylthiotransferase accessory factor
MEYSVAEGKTALSKIAININVPPDFPEKYLDAVVRVAEQCAVKKTIMNPPAFEIKTVVGS